MSARESASPLEARVLPFRRPSATVRVRRRSAWAALRRPFLQALGLVGLPAVAVAFVFGASSFALASVEIRTGDAIDARWVERALAPYSGENLVRLPLASVEQRLLEHPWVESVRLEKRLPDRLRVSLVERRPAALLRNGSELVFLDGDGRVIAPFDPAMGDPDLPLVSVGSSAVDDFSASLAVAEELASVAPDWGASLSEVEALGEGDFRLYIGALPFPLLVRGGTLATRLPALRALLSELGQRYPGILAVDLRSPRRIVLQPFLERS